MRLLSLILRVILFYFLFKLILRVVFSWLPAPKEKPDKKSKYKEKDIIDADFKEL